MKFSSDDILSQTFESKLRGWDPAQVREFLASVAREWDHIVDELRGLRTENEQLQRDLREYRRREKGLHDALEMAKQMADEVRHQAERDAELVVAEAELKAERILSGVEQRVADLRAELMDVQQQRIRFEAELRAVIESHQKMLQMLSAPEQRVDESDIVEAHTDPDMIPSDPPEVAPTGH
jgi:cell division initiation protein